MYSNIIPPKGKTSIRGAIATHARASRSRKATIATPTEDNADPSEEVPIIQKRGEKQRRFCKITDRAVEDNLVEFFFARMNFCGTHRRQSTRIRQIIMNDL